MSKKTSKTPATTKAAKPGQKDTAVAVTANASKATATERAKSGTPRAATLSDQIEALKRLDLDGIRQEYQRVMGHPTSGSDGPTLIARIAEQMVFGGKRGAGRPVGKTTHEQKAATPPASPRPPRRATPGSPFAADPRLPAVGQTITKEWRGKKLEVTVRADGLEFDGKTFRSLSAIASALLGCPANGYLFFGLTKAQTTRATAAAKQPKGTPEQVSAIAKAREARAAKVAARKAAKNPA